MSTELDEVVSGFVGFAAAVRRAGVSSVRTDDFVAALDALDVMNRDDIYWAGRATMCSSPDDLVIFERVFGEWFAGSNIARVPSSEVFTMPQSLGGGDAGSQDSDSDDVTMLASSAEVLRHRDVAELTVFERRQLAWLFSRLRPVFPVQQTRRWEPHQRGTLDLDAMVREHLRRVGEPSDLRFRRRRTKPRRVVFLIDVSKSASAYADQNLRLAHRFVQTAPRRTEVFTLGTRLTRITSAMRLRDPDRALEAAGRVIPDWSGGTRLGENLEAFINRWGRRGSARGAVVIVMSDGWEKGDPSLLATGARTLKRLAHTTIWVNPHRGKEGFEPIQSGMSAVLPHMDHLVAGHTLSAFEEVMEVVAHV